MGYATTTTELQHDRDEQNVPLYFTLKIHQTKHMIAQPQLMGTSDHDLHTVLRHRNGIPHMALDLKPTLRDPHVDLDLQLDLPNEHNLDESITLRHDKETTMHLSHNVEMKVLAMRMKSPEFETYIANAPMFNGTETNRKPTP